MKGNQQELLILDVFGGLLKNIKSKDSILRLLLSELFAGTFEYLLLI